MDVALFALWCFLVAAAGGVAGLVLGNLRLPLALVLASSPAAGAGANIAISAVSAATAGAVHVRAGRVNWRLVRWMAPPSVAGALAGGYLSGELPARALLGVIAIVLLGSGVQFLRRPEAPPPRPERTTRFRRDAVLAGAGIGLLGGVVGLILGTLRMPALLRVLGEPAQRAVGTNLVVGFCVGVAGLVGHLPSAPPAWDLLAVGAAASIPGALLGARAAGRLSERQLIRMIGAVLVVAALATATQALA